VDTIACGFRNKP